MVNNFVLCVRDNEYESTLSFADSEEKILRKVTALFFDYYRPSMLYIRNLKEKKMYRLWLSKELGIMLKEVEYGSISEVESMLRQNGSGCMEEAIKDSKDSRWNTE